MRAIIHKYRFHLNDREFLFSFISALVLLATSLVVNFYAGHYATEQASNPVTDIILSNIPVFDVDGIFVYGAITFWIFVIGLTFLDPKKIPFTLKSIALFTFIRSVFISLTHLGPFASQAVISSNLIAKFSFGGDLFFSGHVGLPFLMALVFWQHKKLRYAFIASSIVFAAVVLMAHFHYSIDVLSAYFITYTIFHLAKYFFKKDYELFLTE
jgi:hypothetical protein